MLATRVIPVLLHRGRQLVKGERFDSWRSVGHVLQAAKIHQARGVDELIVLDISATPEGRGPDFKLVEEITRECFMPLTVGGGVCDVEHVRDLLSAGADKVSICTKACEDPGFISECADKFGSQAIVVAVDSLRGIPTARCGSVLRGDRWWTSWWAEDVAKRGAGEILLTSIDRDGTMQGYDLPLLRDVASAVSIPVIANGGCSGPEDMLAAIKAGASACAAGALFLWTDHTPRGCSEWLAEHGVDVRIPA